MTTQRKTLTTPIELKAEEPGVVVARFATFNVRDKDNDVTLPGAFGNQAVRSQPYGHVTGMPSIAKGSIEERPDGAYVTLRYNLAMTSAKEVYESLKFDMENGEPLTEWSYIYEPVDAAPGTLDGQDVRFLKAIKVHSVEPVFLGAGENTATVQVKEDRQVEEIATAAKALTLPDGVSLGDLEEAIRKAIKDAFPAMIEEDDYCWLPAVYDGEVVFEAHGRYYKTTYALDGEGDVTISGQPTEVRRRTTWELEPTPGKAAPDLVQTYGDHAEHTVSGALALHVRSVALAANRAKEGRALSMANQSRIQSLLDAIDAVKADMSELLTASEPTEQASIGDRAPTPTAVVLQLAQADQRRRELEAITA